MIERQYHNLNNIQILCIMMFIIKKIVYSICLIYTINLFISCIGKFIPINFYTIGFVYFFDFFAIIAIIYLKYYC